MSSADDYNKKQLNGGELTIQHITTLVTEFQKAHGLDVDGKCGPNTRAEIDKLMGHTDAPPASWKLFWPLRTLPDGRKPLITSGFQSPSRPKHVGVDIFFHWKEGDKPDHSGNGGAAGTDPNGKPRWVVPYGETARAAAPGKIQIAGKIDTGYRVWIDHGNGFRTGYFHLIDTLVKVGDVVAVGQPLGAVGDNPVDNDARHLHFEISPVDRYHPIDPEPFLGLFLFNS